MKDLVFAAHHFEIFLSQSAFRHGTSAFRFGLVPENISDHLPITVSFGQAPELPRTLFSWNLLSQQHLRNNFFNISGSKLVEDALNNIHPEHIYSHRMHDLFFELAEYIYQRQKAESEDFQISMAELRQFADKKNIKSRLIRPYIKNESIEAIQKARKAFLALLDNPSMKQEVLLSIQHAFEIYYHVETANGVLQWDKRFEILKKGSPNTVHLMKTTDVICLQEVTSPSDIIGLIDNKDMKVIIHNTDPSCQSKDNCMIMFNSNIYEQVGSPNYLNLDRGKPGILVKLRDKQTHQEYIFGSIHHPGGSKDLRKELLGEVKKLNPNHSCTYIISGDMNHGMDTFNEDDTYENQTTHTYFPTHGTMAGSDYNNQNKAIDGILTSLSSKEVKVCRIVDVPTSKFSKPPVMLKIIEETHQKPRSAPLMFRPKEHEFKKVDEIHRCFTEFQERQNLKR